MLSVSLNACRMLFIIFYVFCRQDMPIKEHNSLLCFIMMLYLACCILGTMANRLLLRSSSYFICETK